MKAYPQHLERYVSPTRFEPKPRDYPNQGSRYTERETVMRAAFRDAVRQHQQPTAFVKRVENIGKYGAGTFRKPEWRLQFGRRPLAPAPHG